MARFGFCGPTYQSESVSVDAQRCINWIPEVVESQSGVTALALYPTWGLKLFGAVTGRDLNDVTSLYEFNGRCFGIAGGLTTDINGGCLFEIVNIGFGVNGNCRSWGFDGNANPGFNPFDVNPSKMIANNAGQLAVAAGGCYSVFNLNTNTWLAHNFPNLSGYGCSTVDFLDGYFLALVPASQQVKYSALEDGTSWDPLDVFQISEFTENLESMLVANRNLWLWSSKRTIVYADTGDPLNPFQPIPGAYVEQGLSAPDSPICIGNQVCWIGGNEAGEPTAWTAVGWTPRRVSNHAVETAWQRYGKGAIQAAVSMGFLQHGHYIWQVFFPNQGTWRYDFDSGLWHEASSRDTFNARDLPHLAWCHAYAFGMHFVGSEQNGPSVWVMSPDYYDDAGTPIRRVRRAPHVTSELEWSFHHKLRVHMETGLGPTPPLVGTALGVPSITVQDANGINWQVTIQDNGNAHATSLGAGAAPQPYIFQDLASSTPAWYQLGIGVGGSPIMLTSVNGIGGGWIKRLLMMTQPGGLQTSISVQNGVFFADPPTTPYREPQVMLRWSDDGGHTWSNEYAVGAGMAGEFTRRIEWRRLGRTRDRVYEISVSDPIPWRVVDGYLFATPSYQPTERYAAQMAKMA